MKNDRIFLVEKKRTKKISEKKSRQFIHWKIKSAYFDERKTSERNRDTETNSKEREKQVSNENSDRLSFEYNIVAKVPHFFHVVSQYQSLSSSMHFGEKKIRIRTLQTKKKEKHFSSENSLKRFLSFLIFTGP